MDVNSLASPAAPRLTGAPVDQSSRDQRSGPGRPALNRGTVRLLSLGLLAGLSGCVIAPQRDVSDSPRYRRPPVVSAPAPAPMYFYPMRQQSEALQDRDRYECYRWAVYQSGVDPGMTPVSGGASPSREVRSSAADPRDGSSVVAGAATGAVAGAVLSSPRHTGQGAVMGAIFGALLGAAVEESRAQSIERQQAARAPAPAPLPPGLNNFRRAMSACMDARGYRVSAP